MDTQIELIESSIRLGDAHNLLKNVPKKSIQLLLTDPPYTVSRKNNFKSLNRNGIDFGEWDKNFDQFSWLDLAIPTLVPGGSCIIFNDWKLLGNIASYLENLGMVVKRMITIKKTNPFPRNITRSFLQTTEHALWAVKPGNKWVFNKRENAPYETGVYECPVQHSGHPTKKSDHLFLELVKLLSNPKDWVLDPFAGAGTTCWACETSDRKFMAIEKNEEYYLMALSHWKKAHDAKSIDKKLP